MVLELIVKTNNSYGVYDYRAPINKSSNDCRTAYYRGHRLMDVPDCNMPGHISDPCKILRHQEMRYDYTGEYGAEYAWKFPKRYEMPADKVTRCTRPQLVDDMQHRLTMKPPKPIIQYDTKYHQDYTYKQPKREFKLTNEFVSKRPDRPKIEVDPNSPGYCKYLDIYMTTKCQDHVPYTVDQQYGIARKDNITLWDWLEYPKSIKGYGLKEFPAKQKEKKEPIYNRAQFISPILNRITPNTPKLLRYCGMLSEMRASYTPPEELAFNCDNQLLNPITIPPTGLRTGTTEYSVYGSGTKIHEYIDARVADGEEPF